MNQSVKSRRMAELEAYAMGKKKSYDEEPAVAYRAGTDGNSSEKIFDMLDLFYANKHMYTRLQHRNRE